MAPKSPADGHGPAYSRAASQAPAALPMDAVLGLGRRAGSGVVVALIMATAVHAGAAVRAALIPIDMVHWTERVSWQVHDRLWSEVQIDVTKVADEPPPPPEPKAKEVEPAPAPKNAVNTPPPKSEPKETPPPPPAAAQAGQVLARDPDPNEPVDLTNTFVMGAGTTYAGGTTQAAGTSTTAVAAPAARANGVQGGTGTGVAAAAPVDRSRVVSCGDSRQWHDACPFPPEADTAQVDDAYVTMQLSVGPDGTVTRVEVVQDPGYGFGRLVKRCGAMVRCVPGLDRDGRATPATTRVRIHFER